MLPRWLYRVALTTGICALGIIPVPSACRDTTLTDPAAPPIEQLTTPSPNVGEVSARPSTVALMHSFGMPVAPSSFSIN
jgi:hypothetical protein